METWHIITIVLALAAVGIIVLAKCCFDDTDPDLDWHNNYAECHRPHVALQNHCQHEGEKTIVTVSSAVNCETTHLVCDDCGTTLKVEHDCR